MKLDVQIQKNIAGHVAAWVTQLLLNNKIPSHIATAAGISAGNKAASDVALTVREHNESLCDVATVSDRMDNKVQQVSTRG